MAFVTLSEVSSNNFKSYTLIYCMYRYTFSRYSHFNFRVKQAASLIFWKYFLMIKLNVSPGDHIQQHPNVNRTMLNEPVANISHPANYDLKCK